MLAFSCDEGMTGDVTNVQRDPAGDTYGEDEREASLEAFLASCSDQIGTSEAQRNERQRTEKSRITRCRRTGRVNPRRTCLPTFTGEVKNVQHGLANDSDRME